MIKILITGAEGQLGRSLKKNIDPQIGDFLFVSRSEFDLCDTNSIRSVLSSYKPEYIINCAAYTAVDKAEEDRAKAFEVNHQGVINLIQESESINSKIIHISTDYVFNGNASIPYKENDTIDPRSVYGLSKAAGEKALQELASSRSIIIRTSWLYSEFGHNFLKTILRLATEKEAISVVDDQFGTPTYAGDLANAVLLLIEKEIAFEQETMILHFSNSGQCNWFEFAKEIVRISALDCTVSPIPSTAFKTLAKRPQFSVLDSAKIQSLLDFEIRNWKEALKECMTSFKQIEK